MTPSDPDPDDVDENGFPPGRDCPTCGIPLEPGVLDDDITIVWMCPNHGPVVYTTHPFRDE